MKSLWCGNTPNRDITLTSINYTVTSAWLEFIIDNNMNNTKSSSPFLNEAREAMRGMHYNVRTEKSYIEWIKGFIYFQSQGNIFLLALIVPAI